MKKEEIFQKLRELELNKEKFIVISGASLVVQDIIEETFDIDLSCSKEYYNEIPWEKKQGHFKTEIKYHDIYEIGPNFYDTKNTITIRGYQFLNLKKCLEIKEQEKRIENKKVIEKIQLELSKSTAHK